MIGHGGATVQIHTKVSHYSLAFYQRYTNAEVFLNIDIFTARVEKYHLCFVIIENKAVIRHPRPDRIYTVLNFPTILYCTVRSQIQLSVI